MPRHCHQTPCASASLEHPRAHTSRLRILQAYRPMYTYTAACAGQQCTGGHNASPGQRTHVASASDPELKPRHPFVASRITAAACEHAPARRDDCFGCARDAVASARAYPRPPTSTRLHALGVALLRPCNHSALRARLPTPPRVAEPPPPNAQHWASRSANTHVVVLQSARAGRPRPQRPSRVHICRRGALSKRATLGRQKPASDSFWTRDLEKGILEVDVNER